MRSTVVLLYYVLAVLADRNVEQLCTSSDAQQSCGQCIKANVECAWCIDPHSILQNRCQLKSSFNNNTCSSHLVYSPQATKVKVQQNLPLETKQRDGKTTIRLQPQATSVRLMPGHSATVSFKYLHQSNDEKISEIMEIQTSDFKDAPLDLKFFVNCEGEKKETKSCRVKNNQIMEFEIKLFLNGCSKTGDITLSVGVLGQRTIAGLYITTICGCECEKHSEMNSRLCHQNGHLVCGQCICNSNHGGDKCECPLAVHGVATASLLEDKCRFNSSSDICNNLGKCSCGQCQCSEPTITGKFCQCDNGSCPVSLNGKICSGNGACDCGLCKCEMGWTRDDCSCSTADNNCVENGELCGNHGKCECNRCICDRGRTGGFCGSEENKKNEAETNKETSMIINEFEKFEQPNGATELTSLPTEDNIEKNLEDSLLASGHETLGRPVNVLCFLLSVVFIVN